MASHGGAALAGESVAGAAAEVDDGSLAGYDSLDAMLAAHLPPDKLREARRVLYGARCSADMTPRFAPRLLVAVSAHCVTRTHTQAVC
jgi:hypothetical protein